jgi:hypothetical protein
MQSRTIFKLFFFFIGVISPHLALPQESPVLPKKQPDAITQPLTSHAQASLQLNQAIREDQSGNTALLNTIFFLKKHQKLNSY